MIQLTVMELIARLRRVKYRKDITYPNTTRIQLQTHKQGTTERSLWVYADIKLTLVKYGSYNKRILATIILDGKDYTFRQFTALFGKSGVGG